MKIRKIQVTRKIEEIIKGYLFRGRYPTFQTITQHFAQWLRDNNPGAPLFKPLKVMRREKSSYEKYNHHIEQIDQDIRDAYQATIQQTNQIMNDFDYIETERGKIMHELMNISKEIDQLLLINENTDFKHYDGYTISFEDAHDVNQKESNVFVDVIYKEVTLSENLRQSERIHIHPNRVQFKPAVPVDKHEALETIQHAFDDSINTAWWHVVKTKTLHHNNQMVGELVIPFTNMETINHIEYVPHQVKPIHVKVEYTTDGTSYYSIHQQSVYDKITGMKVWDFQPMEVKGIKFIFRKDDYDERSGGHYNYYFGAKSISIYKKHYLNEGYFYSNPVSFDSKIQQISIDTKQEMPANTELTYDVALYDKEKSMSEQIWHPIESYSASQPKHPLTVNLKTREQRKIETSNAEATGEVINGMQVFRLMKDNGSGILSEVDTTGKGSSVELFDDFYNPKLFRGVNQWKKERTYIPFRGDVPLNSHWNDLYQHHPEKIRTEYMMKHNNLKLHRKLGGFDDNFYRFNISIFSSDQRSEPLSLAAIHQHEHNRMKRIGTYSVYVNNRRLDVVNDELSLPLIKGWNEIQILFHFGNVAERKDTPREKLPNSLLLGKFNFSKEKITRGDYQAMEYVDVDSLYHNISPNNRNYFSIYERQVVLNYLPEDCIFQLLYDSSKYPSEENQVVMRAHLQRDEHVPHVTPKIYNIQMRVK